MAIIVPRWEWRTFGTEFGAADAAVAALEPELTQESDEIYLLSPGTDAAVKIRAGLMDIKELEHVDEAGLEQWRPAMKETFPLPRGEAEQGLRRARRERAAVRAPTPTRSTSSSRCSPPRSAACARSRSTSAACTTRVDGCMTEVTEVVAEGEQVRTLAIESKDAARVVAAVRELGLADRANTSYPRWLKAAAGMEG